MNARSLLTTSSVGQILLLFRFVWFGFMVFNATFSNSSAISWRLVLLMEEIGLPGKNHRLVTSH